MSQLVPSHYVIQFANTINLLLQQQDSRLGDKCGIGSYKGKLASPVDQLGIVEMLEVGARFSPMGRVDIPNDRRWIAPTAYELPQLLDSFDEHKLLIDPKSKYVAAAHAAAKRRRDRTLIAALFADAKTGEQGGTTTAFPSSQQIAVNFGASGNVSMTHAKMKEALRMLMAADVDVDNEEVYIGLTSKEHDSLLGELQVISLDYNERPVVESGRITRHLGMRVVRTELFATDASGYRRCPVWVKSGLHLGIWQEMETKISQRDDLSGKPWEAYVKLMIGATRTEEEKVVEIKCV